MKIFQITLAIYQPAVNLLTFIVGLSQPLHILTSASIFSKLFFIHFLWLWQGEFVEQPRASLAGDPFLYSYDLNFWCRDYVVWKIWCWSLIGGQRVDMINVDMTIRGDTKDWGLTFKVAVDCKQSLFFRWSTAWMIKICPLTFWPPY